MRQFAVTRAALTKDGSQRVGRLAHHSSVVQGYWDSPRANISRDGRFVSFTSNVEGRGQRDVFILKIEEIGVTNGAEISDSEPLSGERYNRGRMLGGQYRPLSQGVEYHG